MDLSLELMPEEGQSDVGIGCYLLALAAVVVGVEDEAPLEDLLQQYGAHAGTSFRSRCPYDDGSGFVDLSLYSLVDPCADDLKGIGREVLAAKAERGVLAADIL